MKDFDLEQTVIPTPHFDDEATLVSARPVVPISTAETRERWRIVKRALPFIVVAGLVGTIIGFGVGYLTSRRPSEVLTQPPSSQQPNNNLASRDQQPAAGETQSQAPNVESNAASTSTTDGTSGVAVNNPAPETNSPGIPQAKRSRRSPHPLATSLPNQQRPRPGRGAARIQDIFAGSNPQ